jgi:hypothetical protein
MCSSGRDYIELALKSGRIQQQRDRRRSSTRSVHEIPLAVLRRAKSASGCSENTVNACPPDNAVPALSMGTAITGWAVGRPP